MISLWFGSFCSLFLGMLDLHYKFPAQRLTSRHPLTRFGLWDIC
jgi:hypothetical protein